jgi:TRAP-type C4-dicarboxylate transport system permease large subunit
MWVSNLPLPPICIMALICIMFFISGCFLDAMALIMLTIPIVYPVVLQLNFDPVWFGVVIVLISQIAVVTPPVGVNVYVTKGIAHDVPIAKIFSGTFPFLVAMFLLLIIVIIFPDMILWLPNLLVV